MLGAPVGKIVGQGFAGLQARLREVTGTLTSALRTKYFEPPGAPSAA